MWLPELFEYNYEVMNYSKDIKITSDCNSITFINNGVNLHPNYAPNVIINNNLVLWPQVDKLGVSITSNGRFEATFGGHFGEIDCSQYFIKFDLSGGGTVATRASCTVIRKIYKEPKKVIAFLSEMAKRNGK